MLSWKLQIFSSILLVCGCRERVSSEIRAHVSSRIFTKLASRESYLRRPSVKAAIRRPTQRDGQVHPVNLNLIHTTGVSFPCIVISTHECVFVNLRKIPDWRGLKSSEIESFRHSASLRRMLFKPFARVAPRRGEWPRRYF